MNLIGKTYKRVQHSIVIHARRAALCLLAAGLAGCGSQGAAEESRLLEGAMGSLDRLASHVLVALAERDTAALQRVRLTEYEHNELVWPELPASAPEVNFPVEVAWRNIETRNTAALARLFPRFAGHRLGMERAECVGATESFETFEVMTDCYVTFRVDGTRLRRIQLFKDVLVMGGQHKIFRYYYD